MLHFDLLGQIGPSPLLGVIVDIFGGIEGGGTKLVCAVGTGPDHILDEIRFPTSTPEVSIEKATAFFKSFEAREGILLKAIGIACFGPLDPNPDSPTYGYVTTTPKPGWRNTDFAGKIQHTFHTPVGFDTDVNAAALAEMTWGAATGLDSCIYVTVGTGIGGGGIIDNQMIHGLMHPEMGHIRIPHDTQSDDFAGNCPYHGDCLEGLASGPAIEQRWGQRGETLAADHPAWKLEAHYLAMALVNYILILSPQRIILGGGVMEQKQLFPFIRKEVLDLLNNYLNTPELLQNIETYIVPPALGNRAGVLGGIALAQRAYSKTQTALKQSMVVKT
ncbi:MAG: ROK family protein [Anaerolineae bacterium]|nr:ROK family protein [Anaerolineae bacterium]